MFCLSSARRKHSRTSTTHDRPRQDGRSSAIVHISVAQRADVSVLFAVCAYTRVVLLRNNSNNNNNNIRQCVVRVMLS